MIRSKNIIDGLQSVSSSISQARLRQLSARKRGRVAHQGHQRLQHGYRHSLMYKKSPCYQRPQVQRLMISRISMTRLMRVKGPQCQSCLLHPQRPRRENGKELAEQKPRKQRRQRLQGQQERGKNNRRPIRSQCRRQVSQSRDILSRCCHIPWRLKSRFQLLHSLIFYPVQHRVQWLKFRILLCQGTVPLLGYQTLHAT